MPQIRQFPLQLFTLVKVGPTLGYSAYEPLVHKVPESRFVARFVSLKHTYQNLYLGRQLYPGQQRPCAERRRVNLNELLRQHRRGTGRLPKLRELQK